jgi:hypothetical protein
MLTSKQHRTSFLPHQEKLIQMGASQDFNPQRNILIALSSHTNSQPIQPKVSNFI